MPHQGSAGQDRIIARRTEQVKQPERGDAPNCSAHVTSSFTHALDSDFVHDQLRLRSVDLTGRRDESGGRYVLYWMQSTHRTTDNWGLRAAIRAADKRGLPVVIHQGLDPTYPYASARHHAFMLDGARDTARAAATQGLSYQFVLRARREDDRRVVDRLAAQAALVITDLFPTAGVAERTARLAARSTRRVLAVDSSCVVPSRHFSKAEWAARTIRPKLRARFPEALASIEDRPARQAVTSDVQAIVDDARQATALAIDTMDRAAIDALIAQCSIDQTVSRVAAFEGGTAAAEARWRTFLDQRLARYTTDRNEAALDATSGLSPYLHVGQIASVRVVREALDSGAPADAIEAFVDQVTTWRELAYNWCLHTPRFDQLDALPAWIGRTMAEHARDPRPGHYTLKMLESAATDDPLWNAAQTQLLRTGVIHNYARMLWGKSILLWAPTYELAREWMFYLNDKYALDGRDPNSVGGIMWCLGLWDRSWGNKPIWGGIRPMLTSRAGRKFDVGRYVRRWSSEP
jgi:deoxyribodipyrimidine photo-lyase